jgi:hypothetical protein
MRFGEIKARVRFGTYPMPSPADIADAMIRRGLNEWAGHDDRQRQLQKAGAARGRKNSPVIPAERHT